MEFPLLFDLPTRAFCFLTADVALEIKDLKHTARARGGGSSLLSSFRHRFFPLYFIVVVVVPKSSVKKPRIDRVSQRENSASE